MLSPSFKRLRGRYLDVIHPHAVNAVERWYNEALFPPRRAFKKLCQAILSQVPFEDADGNRTAVVGYLVDKYIHPGCIARAETWLHQGPRHVDELFHVLSAVNGHKTTVGSAPRPCTDGDKKPYISPTFTHVPIVTTNFQISQQAVQRRLPEPKSLGFVPNRISPHLRNTQSDQTNNALVIQVPQRVKGVGLKVALAPFTVMPVKVRRLAPFKE